MEVKLKKNNVVTVLMLVFMIHVISFAAFANSSIGIGITRGAMVCALPAAPSIPPGDQLLRFNYFIIDRNGSLSVRLSNVTISQQTYQVEDNEFGTNPHASFILKFSRRPQLFLSFESTPSNPGHYQIKLSHRILSNCESASQN